MYYVDECRIVTLVTHCQVEIAVSQIRHNLRQDILVIGSKEAERVNRLMKEKINYLKT